MPPPYTPPSQEIDHAPTLSPTDHTVDNRQPVTSRASSPTLSYHTIEDLQQNRRPPSPTPTYYTVDGPQRWTDSASSPTPTNHTIGDQPQNEPLYPTLNKNGYNIKAQNSYGSTVLYRATGEQSKKLVRQLPKNESNVSTPKAHGRLRLGRRPLRDC